jgi:hypothetical protein
VPEPTGSSYVAFEAEFARLVGRSVTQVRYWDVHNFASEPPRWDFLEWHRAVMGVELVTDAGSFLISWGDRFHSYGVELFPDAIEDFFDLGPEGHEHWWVENHPRWAPLLERSITATTVHWERVVFGIRFSEEFQPIETKTVVVPTAVRLDFGGDSLWMVAGTPMNDRLDRTFVMGDEILVLFTAERMRDVGFDDDAFLRVSG